jgi:repressor LexA
MVRTKKGLTDRHQKILDFIGEYVNRHGYPPAIRDICEATGISSTSVVTYYLKQLTEMGKIERDEKSSRALRLSDAPHRDLLRVPILGPIAAGAPIPVPDAGATYIADEINGVDVARSLLPKQEKGAELFALKVQGESMIDAMISDGDIVILKSTPKAENGDMVAIWLPARDETTLKYFYKEKERYRLQPANPTMQPIYVNKNEPLEIKGKVMMVIRKVDTVAA